MNVHDSERIAGVLEEMGYTAVDREVAMTGAVSIFAINTCAVRENAANKLYGHLGKLLELKKTNPELTVIVGGCLAQKDKDEMAKRARAVDVVFGTHNLHNLPRLIETAIETNKAQVEVLPRLVQFPSELSAKRGSKHSAWVSISMGCNNTCTFCIVPQLRGKERDRRFEDVVREVEAVVENGAKEVTLLGQNVNSYGSEFGDRHLFSKLLRKMGEFQERGLERVRFTSPHPASFTDDVITAMAETENVMPSLHMPLQSGSDRLLRLMRRSYNSARFLEILNKVRTAIPHAAITTDIIVGFPDETEEDFEETMRVVEEARFSSAYTFEYSIRPGTPAATMENQITKPVVQERFERLLKVQNAISLEEQQKQVGREVKVMISNTQGRKDAADNRVSGYTEDGRLIHLDDACDLNEGDIVSATVSYAAPFHLLGSRT
jgi:tRNA-2-methylthio-N6-dimethylallyladenosine synthase